MKSYQLIEINLKSIEFKFIIHQKEKTSDNNSVFLLNKKLNYTSLIPMILNPFIIKYKRSIKKQGKVNTIY